MVFLADLIKSGEVAVVEEVPGLVWRVVEPNKKAQPAPQRGLFKFWKKQESPTTQSNVKKFTCWTCGKEYVAADFLWHIRECCKA